MKEEFRDMQSNTAKEKMALDKIDIEVDNNELYKEEELICTKK